MKSTADYENLLTVDNVTLQARRREIGFDVKIRGYGATAETYLSHRDPALSSKMITELEEKSGIKLSENCRKQFAERLRTYLTDDTKN